MRLILILVLTLVLAAGYTFAQSTHHTVRAGETLFSISRQYDISVQQLREWNGLSGNVIRVGQRLVVSTGDEEDPADMPAEDRAFSEDDDEVTSHTVNPGETLFRISRMYDVSVDDLKEWNNLDSNTISIGQELVIRADERMDEPDETPDDEALASGDEDAAEITEDEEAEEPPAYYEVRPGDTMYAIATRHNLSVDELREMNNLDDTTLHVGQELRIRRGPAPPPSVTAEWDMESTPQGKFVTYTFSEEDTLDQLLQYHNMDRSEFRALNPGLSVSDIRSGDDITLLLSATSRQKNPYRKDLSGVKSAEVRVTRYPEEKRGQTTTSGDLYNPRELTAAHPSLSLGSVVFVKNPETGRGVFVHINDRTAENRLLLSDAAFQALGYHDSTQLTARIHEADDN